MKTNGFEIEKGGDGITITQESKSYGATNQIEITVTESPLFIEQLQLMEKELEAKV